MVNVSNALRPRRGRRRKVDATKLVAYIRVSTGKQELGPEAQRVSIEAYAAARGLTVAAWYSETVSGAAPLGDRVELFEAIKAAKAQRAGAIIVAKRDRFSRDSFVTELLARGLRDDGIELVAADQDEANGDSPEAILLRRMLDAVAEYERALISGRTRAAMAGRRRRGLHNGGSVPFGFRLVDGTDQLEACPQETPARERIIRERGEGRTIQAITDGLVADGVPARGGRWHRTTVSRILKSAKRT